MTLTNKQILAIDDTPSIRTFLRISLQSYGATFHEAATAQEGLDKCQQFNPDVIVLDLGLPDRDGLDVLPEIISHSQTTNKRPVVIILSVRKEQQTKEMAFEMGATGYVTKPFIVEDLLDVIHEQVGR
jgi:DNA-binding response OmpR family regulator